jgi:hypothetical protein
MKVRSFQPLPNRNFPVNSADRGRGSRNKLGGNDAQMKVREAEFASG